MCQKEQKVEEKFFTVEFFVILGHWVNNFCGFDEINLGRFFKTTVYVSRGIVWRKRFLENVFSATADFQRKIFGLTQAPWFGPFVVDVLSFNLVHYHSLWIWAPHSDTLTIKLALSVSVSTTISSDDPPTVAFWLDLPNCKFS